MKVGRNRPCPCKSGQKYKACCEAKDAVSNLWQKWVMLFVAFLLAGGVIFYVASLDLSTEAAGGGDGKVWSEEHGHWH